MSGGWHARSMCKFCNLANFSFFLSVDIIYFDLRWVGVLLYKNRRSRKFFQILTTILGRNRALETIQVRIFDTKLYNWGQFVILWLSLRLHFYLIQGRLLCSFYTLLIYRVVIRLPNGLWLEPWLPMIRSLGFSNRNFLSH